MERRSAPSGSEFRAPSNGFDRGRDEAEITRARARLDASLAALQDRLSTLTSPGGWFRRRPWPFVAGAFTLGFIWGLRSR